MRCSSGDFAAVPSQASCSFRYRGEVLDRHFVRSWNNSTIGRMSAQAGNTRHSRMARDLVVQPDLDKIIRFGPRIPLMRAGTGKGLGVFA